MSQLKLSGDASGTGIVTVAAPNTNNTYTVTLPAAAGTFAQTDVAQTFTGTQTFNGNVVFGDATTDTITATARLASDLVPSTNNARDLGTSALAYRSVYAGTSFVEAGYNVVTQTDIGTAPNEIPLNQYLGDLAYQDSTAVTVGSLTASGNIILSTAGAGIDFSADSNAAGMTSELLSDYEEGTFTPTITSGYTTPAYSLNTGRYTKVGRICYFAIRLDVNGGTRNANILQMTLPFTSITDAVSANGGGAWFSYVSSAVINSTTTNLPSLYTGSNSNVLQFYKTDGNNFSGNDLNAATPQFYIHGWMTCA